MSEVFGVFQEGICSFLERRVFEDSGESAFCAAYGWFVEEQAEMGGQAESAGMSDSLAVNNEQVRLIFKPFDGGDADGRLAERKQAWYVWDGYLADRGFCFDEFKAGWWLYRNVGRFRSNRAVERFQNDDAGDDVLAVFGESTVEAGDEFRRLFQGGKSDTAGETLLQVGGLCVGQIPLV